MWRDAHDAFLGNALCDIGVPSEQLCENIFESAFTHIRFSEKCHVNGNKSLGLHPVQVSFSPMSFLPIPYCRFCRFLIVVLPIPYCRFADSLLPFC